MCSATRSVLGDEVKDHRLEEFGAAFHRACGSNSFQFERVDLGEPVAERAF